ncbi:MAG: hypothetical protein RLY78_868 [Pseudomonadota bacterium]
MSSSHEFENTQWRDLCQLFDRLLPLPEAQRERELAGSGIAPEVKDDVRGLLDRSSAVDQVRQTMALATEVLPSADAPAWQRLGPWRMVSPIGRGAQGEVWLAERADGAFEGRAAVKVLRPGLDGVRVLERLTQELPRLQRLQHPNIVGLVDAGLTMEGRPYLVSDMARGQPIDRACNGLTLHQRIALFLQLADALTQAHHHLLLHRDLKPSNVRVSGASVLRQSPQARVQPGQVQLLDLGHARAIDPLDEDDPGPPPGVTERPFSPHFASPEQVRGEPLGVASDVYSLGVLLYLSLTGVRPYGRDARSPLEAARSVLLEAPTRPSQLKPDTPGLQRESWPRLRAQLQGDLDAILLKAMAKNVAQRYPTVDALASDLRAWLEHRPVTACRAGRWVRLRKLVRRHRLSSLAVAAGIALGGSALLLLGVQHERRERAVELAQSQRQAALQQLAQARRLAADLGFGLYHRLAAQPSAAGGLRDEVLAETARLLDRLDGDGPNDARWAAQRAAEYHRLSLLQGLERLEGPVVASSAAVQSLGKAVQLAERRGAELAPVSLERGQAEAIVLSQAALWWRAEQPQRAEQALASALAWPAPGGVSARRAQLLAMQAQVLGLSADLPHLGRWREACAVADVAAQAAAGTGRATAGSADAEPVTTGHWGLATARAATARADGGAAVLPVDAADAVAPDPSPTEGTPARAAWPVDPVVLATEAQARCRLYEGKTAEAAALLAPVIEAGGQALDGIAGVRLHLLHADIESLRNRPDAARAAWEQARRLALRQGGAMAARWQMPLLLQQLAMQVRSGDGETARRLAEYGLEQLPPVAGASYQALQRRAELLVWAARAWRTTAPGRAHGWAHEAALLMAPVPAAASTDHAARRWWQAQALGEEAAALAALGRPVAAADVARRAVAAWGPASPRELPAVLRPHVEDARQRAQPGRT